MTATHRLAPLLLLLATAGCGGDASEAPPAETPAAPAAAVAEGQATLGHITATLYYASTAGPWLVPVQAEVPLGEDALAQGRAILATALGAPPEGLVSVFPSGTALRGFYLTERGEAFVDLSAEVAAGHPGGALNELLTVYAVVNAVTTNLPAVERVQILIGGREVDTLAGHVDLRRPLEADRTLVRATD